MSGSLLENGERACVERASIHERRDAIGTESLVLLPGYALANIATEMSEARQLDDYETSWT